MSDDRMWTSTYDTPDETLRALIRRLDAGTSTDEIIRLARIHLSEWRATETRIENIREEVADAQELARTHRWVCEQDDPPVVTLDEPRRLCPADTDGVIHRAEIDAIVAHRLGGRARRTCENPDGVIDCHGPNGYGYRCPECCQQRRRKQAIIEQLHTAVDRARMDDSRLLTPTSDESESTESATDRATSEHSDETEFSPETQQTTAMPRTSTEDDECTADEQETADKGTQNDRTNGDEQTDLDAFARSDGGETA